MAQGEERIRTVIFICKMDKNVSAAQQRERIYLKGKIKKSQMKTGVLNSTGVGQELFYQAPLCCKLILDSQKQLWSWRGLYILAVISAH